MTVFADASAVVKLYVNEVGHRQVRRRQRPFVVAAITRVEVVAALWRKCRTGELDPHSASSLIAEFEFDLTPERHERQSFAVIAATPPLLDDAARMCGVHGLRAYDAVQLASARRVRAVLPGSTTFLTFDQQLGAAATREGFADSA